MKIGNIFSKINKLKFTLKVYKYILFLFFFIFDLFTKKYCVNKLHLGKNSYNFYFINFCYVYNFGIIFGFLDKINMFNINLFIYFISIVNIFINFLLFKIIYFNDDIILNVSYSMIIGGNFGNLFNRVNYGAVVDFLYFNFFNIFNSFIFNIADLFILFGIFIFFIKNCFFSNKNNIL